jgi:tyrosine-specific transport protein
MIIAEVAIKQHQSSGDDVASSFKDFADFNLDNTFSTNLVASLSIFTNACILVFGLDRAGNVLSKILDGAIGPLDAMTMFAIGLVTMGLTQSGENMSKICSALVVALFISFFSILIPGLSNVQDPIGTLLLPGTCDCGISEAFPIILMSMVYQNIVPTVTKILRYDRVKSIVAIALGSFLPLCLYLAWCFACIGGGIDIQSIGVEGTVMTVFSTTAISGSAIGCMMSLTEEFDSLMHKSAKSELSSKISSPLPVIAAVAIPFFFTMNSAGGENFNSLLQIAGSYGSPILYGLLPAYMAWSQRDRMPELSNLVPGGSYPLLGLLLGSLALITEEFLIEVNQLSLHVG